MTLPDAAAVLAQIAAFEAELAEPTSARDAQAVRDRYLGRKNSVVASLDADDRRRLRRPEARARPLRQRTEAGDRGSAGRAYQAAAATTRGPRGAVDVTLPGRDAGPRPSPSAHDRPRSSRGHLHAHGIRDRRRTGGRRRLALLRRAEHAGGASRARHAGHAVPRVAHRRRLAGRPADAAAHAHLVDADPLHAGAPAADPHRRAGPRVPARRSRPDALAGVRSDRRPRRRRRHLSLADLKGTLLAFAREMFSPTTPHPVPARASFRTPSRAPKST